MSLGLLASIKTFFATASVGVKSTVVIIGVVTVTSAVAIPVAIITNTNHEAADTTGVTADETKTNEDNKSEMAGKDITSNQDNKENIDSSNDSEQNSTSSSSNQEVNNNHSSNSTSSANSQSSNTSSNTKPQGNSNVMPQKPQTSTSPSQSSNPQPSTPTKTEEELRNERDQKRRADIAKVKTGVIQFQVNNNGKLPTVLGNADGTGDHAWQPSRDDTLPPQNTTNIMAKFIRNYLNATNAAKNTFKDPDGWAYGMFGFKYDSYINFNNKNQQHMIYLISQAKCGVATSVLRTENTRDFAVVYKLENGNNYCVDNQ